MVSFMQIVLFISLMLSSIFVQAVTIQVTTDRNPVSAGESFQLIFEASESPDSDPDFSPLSRTLEILRQNRNSSFQYVNGKMNKSIRWTLTVVPLTTGDLAVPAISFGKDNSKPLIISVKEQQISSANGANANLLLEVSIDQQKPYVQQQITLSVKVLQAIKIDQASISDPAFSVGDAVIEPLGKDSRYEITRNKLRYLVTERRYALFPQISGTLIIAPFQLQAVLSNTTNRRRSLNSFFNQGTGTIVRRTSEAIEVDVRPVPESFTGKHWLPAYDVTLKEQWSDSLNSATVGEPITRSIKLLAHGLGSSQLPELSGSVVPNWKTYPDQPELKQSLTEGVIQAERIDKIAMIPTQAGRLTLPEIKIIWWNINEDHQQTAIIPERIIEVAAANNITILNPVGDTKQITESTIKNTSIEPSQAIIPVWVWAMMSFLMLGWLATLLICYRSRKRQEPFEDITEAINNERQTRRILKTACHNNDLRTCREALHNWARLHWPENRLNSLTDIALLCKPKLAEEIGSLNHALYAQDKGSWNGQSLWSAFNENTKEEKQTGRTAGERLQPLNRIN